MKTETTTSIDWGIEMTNPQETATFEQIQDLILRYSQEIEPPQRTRIEDIRVDPIKVINNGIRFSPRNKTRLALLNEGVRIIKSKIAQSEGLAVDQVRKQSTSYPKKVGVIQELVEIMSHPHRSRLG